MLFGTLIEKGHAIGGLLQQFAKERKVWTMKVKDFYELGFSLIKDDTEIWVRGFGEFGMKVLAHGNWYQDDVLKYVDYDVECFHWQDDNTVYIDVK